MGPVPPGPPAPPGVPMRVVVPVTTVWSAPDRPRRVDAPIVADHPDHSAWLTALDRHADDDERGQGRLGLHGRVLSQVVAGEPVLVLEAAGATATRAGWVPVVCPWQPSVAGPPGLARVASPARTSSPTTPAATATGRRTTPGPLRPARTVASTSPSLASTSGCRTCGAGPHRWAWTAPDWSISCTATWAGSSPGTPTTSRRPVRRYRSPRLGPATSTSSPGATAGRPPRRHRHRPRPDGPRLRGAVSG